MTAKCAYVIKRAEKKRVIEKEIDNAKKWRPLCDKERKDDNDIKWE